MKIIVNNEVKKIVDLQMLPEVLVFLGYGTASNNNFAIAVNETFVPRSAYEQTQIQEGDKLEIVAPMQGG